MKTLLRLLPRLARDRALRLPVVAAILLVVLAPALRVGRSGFAAGLAVGGDGAASTGPLLVVLLALAAPWIGEGVVSGPRRDGSAALAGVRPLPRAVLPLAGWAAAGVVHAGLAVGVACVLNAAWAGGGPPLSLMGAVAAAAILWAWVGSAALLLSSVLDRGEAPLAAALVLLPALLGTALAPTDPIRKALALVPTRPALRAAREALTGGVPAGADLLPAVVGGALLLGAGLAVAARRDVGP